jgi:Protein of unknown function (DUF3164)
MFSEGKLVIEQVDVKSLLTPEQIKEIATAYNKEHLDNSKKSDIAYNQMKYNLVEYYFERAENLEALMKIFHDDTISEMEGFREVMREHGKIRSNSLGGFQLDNDAKTKRISLKIERLGYYDERADMAEACFRQFFEDTLKEQNPPVYNAMMKLLERKKGKMEYSRAAQLISMRDEFSNENWLKACELLAKAWVETGKKFYLVFEKKDENEKWITLKLNLSSQ